MRRAKWHQLASCLGNDMGHFQGQGFEEFSMEHDHTYGVLVLPTPNMRLKWFGIWTSWSWCGQRAGTSGRVGLRGKPNFLNRESRKRELLDIYDLIHHLLELKKKVKVFWKIWGRRSIDEPEVLADRSVPLITLVGHVNPHGLVVSTFWFSRQNTNKTPISWSWSR